MAKKGQVPLEKVEFDFVKANHHRMIHVDGAWGGVSPHGGVHMSVYSEIPKVPTKIIQKVVQGKLGEELERQGDGNITIIRELEATLLMNLETAIVIRDWLTDKIDSAQKARNL